MIHLMQTEKKQEKNLCLKDLAEKEQKSFAGRIVLAEVNGSLKELTKKAKENDQIRWLDATTPDGYRTVQRGLSFLLVWAVQQVLEEQGKQGYETEIECSINQGFYCEIRALKDGSCLSADAAFLQQVSERMKKCIQEDIPLRKHQLKTKEVAGLFHKQGMPDKAKLMKYRRASETNVMNLKAIWIIFTAIWCRVLDICRIFRCIPMKTVLFCRCRIGRGRIRRLFLHRTGNCLKS